MQTWPYGEIVHPVDRDQRSPVRRDFSSNALGRSIAAVTGYWQQMIFSGRGVPPPEMSSDEEVVRYVLREPGAIGYVASAADLRGARVLTIK